MAEDTMPKLGGGAKEVFAVPSGNV